MHSKTFSRSLVAAAVIAALGGGYVARDFVQPSHAQATAAAASTAAPAVRAGGAMAQLPDFSQLVREKSGS